MDARKNIYLAVVGTGSASSEIYELAEAIGREAASRGWIVLTGGLGGVMEAAARGAHDAGGLTLGVLPGEDRSQANSYIHVAVATNMSHARNAIIAHTADALIAIDGEYGTLSEVAFGLKLGKPVVGLKTPWKVPGLLTAKDPKEAVARVAERVESRRG